MFRAVITTAAVLGFATAAFAAQDMAMKAPTMEQCKMGYKEEYSKMWTQADFKKACDTMMMDKKNKM